MSLPQDKWNSKKSFLLLGFFMNFLQVKLSRRREGERSEKWLLQLGLLYSMGFEKL